MTCTLNSGHNSTRKKEKQKRKSNFFKLSFVKTLCHPSTKKKKERKKERKPAWEADEEPFETRKCPFNISL